MARKDPREVFEEVQRNKSMKKESLQRAFVDDEEEEENKQLVNMLETMYENHELVRGAMLNHLGLMDTMNESETIIQSELHQKKTLRQVRQLIDSIVMKRKLRTSIGSNYQVGSIAKPPSLDDVREDTIKSNKYIVAKMMAEINAYTNSKNSKPLTRTKSPQSSLGFI